MRRPRIERRWRPVAAIAACSLLWALGACSGFEERLRPESEIPELAHLGAACDALPHQVFEVESDPRSGAPLHVAIHEFGSGNRDHVVVAIHGVLSDHGAWRYLIGDLGQDFDIWAVDMPGCGASDSPGPSEVSEDGYTPTWLARHLLGALRAQLWARDANTRLTLVGHSLGGGVVLRMLGDQGLRREFADVLARVDDAVLISPLDFGFGRADPTLVELARIHDLEVAIGTSVGEVRRAAAEAVYQSYVDPERIPRREFDRTYDILTDPVRRHAMKLMLARAVPRNEDASVVWEQALRLAEDYASVKVPCLIVWGERDETLPSVSGYHLLVELPDARLRLIKQCMHSAQVEEPRLCAQLIRSMRAKGIADWEPRERLDRLPPMRPADQGELETRKISTSEEVSRSRLEPAAAAPSTVSVLSGRDVQRSGARYLSDALRMVPGVEVQRISSTESGVAFRGYVDSSTAAQGTLGLLDGRQVYNQFLGNVLWDQLPVRLEDVKRIEIIRGPGSFIHGPNAMHGVVSIETKAPLDYVNDSVSATVNRGNYGSIVAGTTVVNRTPNTAFKTSAQWDDIGQFDNDRGDTRDKGFFESAFETRLDGDPNHVIGVAGGVSQQRFDLLLPLLEVIPPTIFDNRATELFAKADYRVGDPDDQSFKVRFSWTGFDSESMPDAYYSPFDLDLDTLDLDAQMTWAGDLNALTAGAGYRNSSFLTFAPDVADGRHTVQQGWVFAQDELTPVSALTFTFGVRVDLHSETDASWSPRAAAVWEPIEDHFFRASAGRGFRNPTLRELWFDMPIQGVPGVPGTITIAGNQDLEPESLTSFELGYFGSWGRQITAEHDAVVAVDADRGGHQFEAGVSLFYNLIDDLIAFQSDPNDPFRVLPMNQSDEDAYGFELEGRYVFSDYFSAFGNYSFVVRRDRATDAENRLAPRNVINAGIAGTGFGFNSMLWANYYDDTELFGIDIDSYVLVNGSISYAFPVSDRATGQAFLRVFNLLDDDHREHPQGDVYGLILSGGLQLDW